MSTLELILSENHESASAEASIQHALLCSPFLKRLLTSDADLLQELLQNATQAFTLPAMQAYLDARTTSDETLFKQHLRQLRQSVLARIVVRDLSGKADFHEVAQTTSALAELCIQRAISFCEIGLQSVYGTPRDVDGNAQALIVIGMGKLGGKELNVSSDVDLIFAYESAGETDGETPISNQAYFVHLGKKIIEMLDEITAHGFVFRVDMRLRPFGQEGALVSSVSALEDYYQHHGREWERYAWIKGRVIAGPSAMIRKVLMPFVFRKYLDYSAYASMRDLKIQIQRGVVQKGAENNIKLGRGGIREIEFIAQVFQLIRGGQDTELQVIPTLDVLALLAQKGLIDEDVAQQLSDAYVFLRNVEHRIMYFKDQQTHVLPTTEEGQRSLLAMLNISDWDSFMAQLSHHRDLVQNQFDAVFSDMKEMDVDKEVALWQGILPDNEMSAELLAIGYEDTSRIYDLLKRLRESSRYQKLPEASKQRFDRLMPHVIQQAAQLDNADTALLRSIHLLENICRRASYLALLAEFPQALSLVVKLCAASPWVTDYLSTHPILLDELLDREVLYAAPDFDALKAELIKSLNQCAGDVEMQMDATRHFKHAVTFRIAAQDIAGLLSLEVVSDYLSQLAQTILEVGLEAIWQDLQCKHRETPQFAVIGYGKLGGKELGYMSDLDIIFLYQDTHADAADIYARYAQRINSWFNSVTNAGLLYEIDMQLRPDGNSGLLVSEVQAFERYQLNKAWVWEHQAITRAHFVAGDADIGQAFEAIREKVMATPSDAEKLKKSVVDMRATMREAKHIKAGVFDIKQSAGSIIDVEFIVQYLVLVHAHQHKSLLDNVGNIALLERLGALEIIDATLANKTANAYRTYRRVQHAARLQGNTQTKISDTLKESTEAVRQLWESVFN